MKEREEEWISKLGEARRLNAQRLKRRLQRAREEKSQEVEKLESSSDESSFLSDDEEKNEEEEEDSDIEEYKKQKIHEVTPIEATTRTGGIYVPPFKMQRLLRVPEDRSSPEFQKLAWEALRKSLNGLINKVNISNIRSLIPEIFQENLVWGQGLFARSIMKAQAASPSLTNIYASLLSVVNAKIPDLGLLVIHRVILQFRRAYYKNHKLVLLACLSFVAHMINQEIVRHLLGLQMLLLFFEKLTEDSVEVACAFMMEIGKYMLTQDSPAHEAIMERFRSILHEGTVEPRTQYAIERLFAVRKGIYKDYPAVPEELDLVEEDEKICHSVDLLDESIVANDIINIFQPLEPSSFLEMEHNWEEVVKDLLGEKEPDRDEDDDNASSIDSDIQDEDDKTNLEETRLKILDYTEQDLVNLRKSVYLAIQSSASFEECVHKIMKMKIPEGGESEVCTMLIDCSAMGRIYERFFALQAERLCRLNPLYTENFLKCFEAQYQTIHLLDITKGRNTAKFFAHLLYTDAMPWSCLKCIELSEQSTTSSSRIFIKNLFQEMAENLGLNHFRERLKNPEIAEYTNGIFQTGSTASLRFCINYFTSIGLGSITEELREILTKALEKRKK